MEKTSITSDVVVGLQHGDEGKGKVTHSLIKKGKYTHCVRFNGGPNAGHTVYHNKKQVITHHIPTGLLYNITSVIGPGCVINPKVLLQELDELQNLGIDTTKLKIAYNAHIISDTYVREDIKTDTIGSTGQGIMPTYRNKYGRTGTRAEDIKEIKKFLCDPIEELNKDGNSILFEGAQGFKLDIDWGDYPYVTSSHILPGVISTCGVSIKTVNKIYGVAKLYETYVGAKKFQPKGKIFNTLQKTGKEYGATTGRARQCNWLNLSELKKAIIATGTTDVIINKCDIIESLGVFKTINPDKIFKDLNEMKQYISKETKNIIIHWSSSPYKI